MIFEGKVVINRPIKEVWDFIDNPENMGKWLKGFQKFEHISGKRGTVGAKSKHYYIENGREVILDEEITNYIPYQEFSGILSHSTMTTKVKQTFRVLSANQTEVMMVMDTTFHGLIMRISSLFIKKTIQQRLDEHLNEIKNAFIN